MVICSSVKRCRWSAWAVCNLERGSRSHRGRVRRRLRSKLPCVLFLLSGFRLLCHVFVIFQTGLHLRVRLLQLPGVPQRDSCWQKNR